MKSKQSNLLHLTKPYIISATQNTAFAVSQLISKNNFQPDDELLSDESKLRERLIDQTGVDAMYQSLKDVPFKIEIVGSEGKKHIFDYGEVMPTLEGILGQGDLTVSLVNDVVEGSKAAKLNKPGAVSVVAISSHLGLLPTPMDVSYLDKLFGPPQLTGKISIDNSALENLKITSKVFGVPPNKINVVVLDRERNRKYIDESAEFGANVILIQAGDFLPSILSCLNPDIQKKGINLLMGIGGFEEGVMAFCAAKALGAFGEGRSWDENLEIRKKYPQKLTLNDLVPGKIEDCLVSITAITIDDKWLDLAGITKNNQGLVSSTIAISAAGFEIIKKVH